MKKEHFQLLAKYNKETNGKMNAIIETLSEDEWNKVFSGHFKSIHELCSHLFVGDYTWLNRFRPFYTFKSLPENYFQKNLSFQELLFESIGEYVSRRIELDKMIIAFTDELHGDDFEKTVKWTNSKGISFEKKLSVCLIHLSNHETHHRGMISLYLEMLGKENDYSNLYPYG